MKKKLIVSFSGGETSAFMSQWLWQHRTNDYEMLFVFANTGEEREETLEFVQHCSDYFGFAVNWIECEPGCKEKYRSVDFKTASRHGEPFEKVIRKYGIPNIALPHCSRELKEVPITAFSKNRFGKPYYTAIGIRSDEVDRISPFALKKKLIYPLISKVFLPGIMKPDVNLYWSKMPFRLNLKGYEGNCKWCWKKSRRKLLRIAKDTPSAFDFPQRMEELYGNFIPDSRSAKLLQDGKSFPLPITFFRNHLSAKEILQMAQSANPIIRDESRAYTKQATISFDDTDDIDAVGGNSCEVFSDCR